MSIQRGNQWHVEAIVRGSLLYGIELTRTVNQIEASCDCPYFNSDGLCKHIWATVLAAEQKNYLLGRVGSGPPLMIQEAWDPESLDDEMDEEGELDEEAFQDFSNLVYRYTHRGSGRGFQSRAPKRPQLVKKPQPPAWRKMLAQIQGTTRPAPVEEPWREGREIYYVIDAGHTLNGDGVYLEINCREPRKTGGWGKLKQYRMPRAQLPQIPDERDREALLLLGGVQDVYSYGGPNLPGAYWLRQSVPGYLLPKLCATGRCVFRKGLDLPFEDLRALAWDDGAPWRFKLRVEQSKTMWIVRGFLLRGEETMELSEPDLLLDSGLLFAKGRVGPYEEGGAFPWIRFLRGQPEIEIPLKHGYEFVAEALNQAAFPPVDWPEGLRFEEIRNEPRSSLKLSRGGQTWQAQGTVTATLEFDYGGHVIPFEQHGRGLYEPRERRYWHRDEVRERAAVQRLADLGLKKTVSSYGYPVPPRWTVPAKKLPKVIQQLVHENWQIESDGKLLRNAGSFHAELTSGIDWFELHGDVEFGDEKVLLPELLRVLERGENLVSLQDGSYGVIPDDLREKYGLLAGFGRKHEDHLRYSRTQAGLLDVLLAGRAEIRVDEIFSRIREEIRAFEGIEAASQPEGFVGQLRDYQLDGLAWMNFLRRFGFGGCLADDMGVGKTPQVLALLETRRKLRAEAQVSNGAPSSGKIGPSLAVVPRSLIYNWQREAERFTPQLRVLDHSGGTRDKGLEKLADYDLVLTTYGTLRRDATRLQAMRFDYIILDEAQAIKNAATESAKAARLLQGNHRLALSGTPVENHLGELWSIFEFLNPGMLGAASAFQVVGDRLRNPDDANRQLLAKAVRPFILRRTKQQVASELPPKTEQTLYCELDANQRRLYDELRNHYRAALLARIERDGMARSQIMILEALLRLRQAACHAGLIDTKRSAESSAKLEALLPQVTEVTEEGHKALIFSQFTSFLAILRKQLDAAGIAYEYLDGKTRNREACVDRFQTDPKCKLFLVSLKAGGIGLNLAAAEYVFLLDPWWNPAVEAQAIDRAHRIGQVNPVFAYRLIARDTVEEKVIELQNTKRDLADSIIRADTRLVGNLKREDLELLLS
ncbi:MAG TPA: DEAD/DEAH box helicase [Bryobacteraceae bacterium]|nr:DEAD/DEAH box helicase [Bryobacteraceae bacterium]